MCQRVKLLSVALATHLKSFTKRNVNIWVRVDSSEYNSKSISEYSPGYYHPHVNIFIACENSAKCYLCDNHGPSKAMYV